MGAELFHEDVTNPIVAFRNFANAHKNCSAGDLRGPAAFGVSIFIAESYALR
jgi:hypothetical protein